MYNNQLIIEFNKFIKANKKQQDYIVAAIRNRVTPTSLWLLLMSPKGYTKYQLECLRPIVDDIVDMIKSIDLNRYGILLEKFIYLLINKIPLLTVASLKLAYRVLKTYELYHNQDRGFKIMIILQSILQVIEEIKLSLQKSFLNGIEWGLDHGTQFEGETTTTTDVTTKSCVLHIRVEHNQEKNPIVYLDNIEMITSWLDQDEKDLGLYIHKVDPEDVDDSNIHKVAVDAQGGGGKKKVTSNEKVVPESEGGKTSITSHEEVVEEDGGGRYSFTSPNHRTKRGNNQRRRKMKSVTFEGLPLK